jgi:signal transduction histidine kinase
VDKERIIEVIYNILDNALKFTESGTISISLAKSSDGKEAVISVKDSGTGIDPLVLPKLFTKFTSSKSLLDKTGFGLGLYVSKAIIEAHGGKIRAENNEKYGGNGATFTFTLPITGHPIGN